MFKRGLQSFLIQHVTQTVTHRLFSKKNYKNMFKNNYLGIFNGAPGGIRTPDQVVRSHLLYPAELRVRKLRIL